MRQLEGQVAVVTGASEALDRLSPTRSKRVTSRCTRCAQRHTFYG